MSYKYNNQTSVLNNSNAFVLKKKLQPARRLTPFANSAKNILKRRNTRRSMTRIFRPPSKMKNTIISLKKKQ